MRTKISYDELVEMYEEALNEGGDVEVGHLTFERARIVRELDPIAYRCGLSDYYDAIHEDYYCEEME